MRSLRYLLGGKPKNIDDCLHYIAMNGQADRASVGLKVAKDDIFGGQTQTACITFHYPSPEMNVNCLVYLGSYDSKADHLARQVANMGAERLLNDVVIKIENVGVPVDENIADFTMT